MIDCHCHIEPAWLANHAALLKSMLARCRACNIEMVVVSLDCSSGTTEFDLDTISHLFQQSNVKFGITLGFTPPSDPSATANSPALATTAINNARAFASHPSVIGIGEVGLDYYWPQEYCHTPQEIASCHTTQQQIFGQWIDLAIQLQLPLVVHERQAWDDALAIISNSTISPRQVMFHCFGSTPQDAASAQAAGYWISIPSSITHRTQYQEVVASLTLNQVLTETDSPYHSPITGYWKEAGRIASHNIPEQDLNKYRQSQQYRDKRKDSFLNLITSVMPLASFDAATKTDLFDYFADYPTRARNEPAFITCAAPAIARIKDLTAQQVRSTTTNNAKTFYHL